MTDEEKDMAEKLGRCTFLPGSFDKRFTQDMVDYAKREETPKLTEKQASHLRRLFHKYRKQISQQPQ